MINSCTPLLVGEALFDVFQDEKPVLGGAPFNVAWHLQAFGLRPLLITRIGNDTLGDAVLSAMRRWEMTTQGVQRDKNHPTGSVTVTLSSTGNPSFTILEEQAYDFLNAEEALEIAMNQHCSLLYHGSLIARHAVSHSALFSLRERLALPLFVDINLRAPWWHKTIIQKVLRDVQWLKLNLEESRIVTGKQHNHALLSWVREQGLEALLITMNHEGAAWITPHAKPSMPSIVHEKPPPTLQTMTLLDTVGAGDAFASVVLLGIHHQWPPSVILQRAVAFAASICSIRGAIPQKRHFYDPFLKTWFNNSEENG